MRGFTEEELQDRRPRVGRRSAVEYCITRLYEDDQYHMTDEVVEGLTYEELLGALLCGRDSLIAGEEE